MVNNNEEDIKELKQNLKNTIRVPLVVKEKPNKEKRMRSKKKDPQKEKKDRTGNAILIGIVVLLLLITSYTIINKIIDSNKKPVVVADNSNKKKKMSLNKKWITADGAMFYFAEDETFYWYEESTDTKDNYYEGTYAYKQGKEALKEMGYNENEFIKIYGDKILEDNIYSLELSPSTAYIEGKDQTSTFIPKDTKWWFILIIKNEGGAIAYNKTLDIRYHLESQ